MTTATPQHHEDLPPNYSTSIEFKTTIVFGLDSVEAVPSWLALGMLTFEKCIDISRVREDKKVTERHKTG